ncbi:MAG: HAD family hydrolase [Kofleriaceae bacterium]
MLLDLDDTLFDRTAAFARWARARGFDATALTAIDRRGHRARSEFAGDAARLGMTIDPERFPFELAEHVEPEPAVRETVEALARSHRVAIVTNGGGAQRVKLARLALDGIVHAVFVSSEVGSAKPDHAIFERALAWLELPAGEVLFVGDEPAIDLAPAAALGMATAWRVRSEWPVRQPPPTHTITSIPELEALCA